MKMHVPIHGPFFSTLTSSVIVPVAVTRAVLVRILVLLLNVGVVVAVLSSRSTESVTSGVSLGSSIAVVTQIPLATFRAVLVSVVVEVSRSSSSVIFTSTSSSRTLRPRLFLSVQLVVHGMTPFLLVVSSVNRRIKNDQYTDPPIRIYPIHILFLTIHTSSRSFAGQGNYSSRGCFFGSSCLAFPPRRDPHEVVSRSDILHNFRIGLRHLDCLGERMECGKLIMGRQNKSRSVLLYSD